MTLLWAKQHDGKLTHTTYDEIGGVEKALADHAEVVYGGLNEAEQIQAQRIFVQLVRPGEGTEDTLRLATRAEIGEEDWELVVHLSSARLVVSGRDETTGEETAEIAHEALIKGWYRLRAWMEKIREFRTWQERLRIIRTQWENNSRDNGSLLRGAALTEAERWLRQHPDLISEEEEIYIRTSMKEVRKLQARELDLQRRLVKRQRMIIGMGSTTSIIFVVGLIVILILQNNLLGTQRNLLASTHALKSLGGKIGGKS